MLDYKLRRNNINGKNNEGGAHFSLSEGTSNLHRALLFVLPTIPLPVLISTFVCILSSKPIR